MALITREQVGTTISKNNKKKLNTLAKKNGMKKSQVLDAAVDAFYQQTEETTIPKHKGIVISIANNKGGVGKTTTTAAFADLFSKRGNKVLLIDSDPQGNLSGRFGYTTDHPAKNYFGALIQDRTSNNEHRSLTYYINHLAAFPRIDIIVSDLRLDGVYNMLASDSIASSTMFRDLVEKIRAMDVYDIILIDARPALNNEVGSAFIGSDYIIIPIEAAMDSVIGANSMVQFMIKSSKLNKNLKLLGVFFNKVQDRTTSFHELLPMVQGNWDKELFKTRIPRNQDVVNAENEGVPVTFRYPACKASKAYAKLLDEVVERLGKN